ncbi:metallophosphoesterase [Natronococcus pandeyae]|uniref:Metallophosphoesterase n=1 Tax=Natronococcus pandeyae TaxID=2055836 RepID=A0A8J8Q0N6_9EURY|nr:metallophosphoesterase [Natronococcus pandeyae]TYL36343.1 metallophosphoesterase [Natronococcus pandeyae]
MGIVSDLKDRLNLENKQRDAGMDKEEGVTRLFFATDVHGSDVCWRKFVNSAEFYDADVLVLGGDTTGKAIFPIIDEGNEYRYRRSGSEHRLEDEDELEDLVNSLSNQGYYPYVLDEREYEDLKEDDSGEREDEIFETEMKKRVREWCSFAEERLPEDVPVFVCPGNDDPFSIDPVWEESDAVTLTEGEVVEIDEEYTMASSGWTNRSPWDTYREEDEDDLERRLEGIVSDVDDTDRCIFNFHDPPYESQLDEAPELDEDRRPKYGAQTTEPVGSTAVRNVIERYQPPLSLHGHVHESRGKTRIGETVAVNPGSVYSEGSLQGAVIDLHPEVNVLGLVRG